MKVRKKIIILLVLLSCILILAILGIVLVFAYRSDLSSYINVKYTANAKTITFNDINSLANAEEYHNQKFVDSIELQEPIAPVANNKLFLGWYSDETYTEEVTFPVVIQESINLYPRFLDGNIDNYLAYDSTKDCYYVTTTAYTGTDTTLVIPDYYTGSQGLKPVGYIADGTYDSALLCYNIVVTKVYFGSNITTIGNCLAYNSSYIEEVYFASNSIVTSIGEGAFESCIGLTSITIPNSVTSIGSSAFEYCDGLTSITIPSSVTNIGDDSFGNCDGLTSIKVVEGNTVYDSRNNCNAIIETSTNTLVVGCKNTIIPNSVTSIGSSAFYNCTGLTSITIPNSITSIGSSAFGYCTGLTSITIPSSVASIGEYVFSHCESLISITIPEGVKSIGARVFTGCDNLTSITIPSSVTSIGSKIFDACYQLVQIRNLSNATISDLGSNPYVEVRGAEENFSGTIEVVNNKYNVYNYDGKKILLGLVNNTFTTADDIPANITEICQWAFHGCSLLTSVIIPSSVTNIGDNAFRYCRGLTSVTIQEDVTSIGDFAFNYCTGLTSITIPSSVKTIGEYVFGNCSGLTSLTIQGDNSAWTKSSDGITYTSASVDFSDPAQNATYFKSTSGYYNHYWKRA